ncbi:hypothetical protein [Amycolatopsis sp. NBC_01286]|uniref:hypothetical protein n=1 Tax=Amycolatopsis sp. NBC_01286 TaxID=2903560 RepID=UPI002E117420|nr:hypothetical protein OG570_40475 [Amycolatopsis sp. NBC_01286]
MEQKKPVATTAKVEAVKAGPVKQSTAAEAKEREAFRAALPSKAEFTKAVLANLEKDLKAALAADPDLKGVSKDELAAWVAADVDEAFAAMAKPGWSEA